MYAKLKADTLVLKQSVSTAIESYDFEFAPARKFFEFCENQRQRGEVYINAYPILHQLYQGRLLIINQSYTTEEWRAVFKCGMEFSRDYKDMPLHFIYLESCDLPLEAMEILLRGLSNFENLREVIFVRTKIIKPIVAMLVRYLSISKKASAADFIDKKMKFMQANRKVKF